MAVQGNQKAGHIEPADIERLLEVAGRLFAENGYDGVGVRLIAKESGVKMPSIFYHFGSKSSLYEEVLDYKYEAITKTVSEAISRLDDPMQKLECIIGTFFDLLLKDRAFLMLLHRDIIDVIAHRSRPAYSKGYSHIYSLFCTLLEAALDHPVERHVAFPLVSLIQGFCELTAVISESDSSKQEGGEWYAERRAELIEAGKRICLI